LLDRVELDRKRADYRAALISSVIVNVNRGKNKKKVKPSDFLGESKKQKRSRKNDTWQKQLSFVEALNVAFGGRDKRGIKKGG